MKKLVFFLLIVYSSAFIIHNCYATEVYFFETKWGSYGSGNGQFYNPYGVAVDNSGNIYVADRNNMRIQKFTSDGTFLTKWGSQGSGDGQFSYPEKVAVDSSGNIYVADYNNSRIQKFSSEGTFLTKWGSSGSGDGQFSYPRGVAADSSGNVYVADTSNHRIQKFSSTGTYIAKWGGYGSGNGQLYYPYGVAVDNFGNVYVADTSNYRIQKFTSTGTFITKWGSYGSVNGQFNSPYDVAVDPSGNVYVADDNNHRIQKFASDGTFLSKWGSSGSGDGQFSYPRGVAVDSSGNLYVADSNNHRIQKFKGYPAGWISGKVTVSGSTTTISGALIELLRDSVIASTTTNTSGNYSMFIPTGSYTVRATASGYGIAESTGVVVVENSTTTVNLSLVAAGQVKGLISTDTTWSLANSPYLVTGNLLVDTGATLTIEPGVVVKFSTSTYLKVKGALKAQGNANNHIIFTSDKASPVAGDWTNIEFSSGCDSANSIVSYCEIKYAQYGFYLNYGSPKEISNNIISNNSNHGIYLYYSGAGTTIANNTIENNNSYGIYSYYGTGGTISGNTVRNNSSNGIYIYYPSGDISVSNNTIEGNNGYGIYYYSGYYYTPGTMQGNVVRNNSSYGIYFGGYGYFPTVSNSTITHNGSYGIYQESWSSGRVKIFSNSISSHTTAGLYLQNAEVSRNQITGNGYGIQINGSNVTITKNTITGNTRGIQGGYAPQSLNKNNLHSNTEYDFYNNTTSGISIPYNWWGTTVTTSIDAKIHDINDDVSYGRVTYTPVETSEVQWWINNAPTLSWTGETNYVSDGLHPETGDSETDFVYRVKYTDIDGDEPMSGYPKLHILKDASEILGSPFVMSLAGGTSDYTTGAIFSYTTLLTPSTAYTYLFEAYDLWGSSASGAPTILKDDPDVTLAPPGTIVSGLISANTTWTVTGSPYKITDNLLVDKSAILTIEPGVTVKLSTNVYLRIDGGLKAVGKPDNLIIFTSAKKTKSPGDWKYIEFRSGSDANSIISYCEIKYAEDGIYLNNTSPKEISNNIISNNSRYGIYCYYTSSHTVISGNTIKENNNYGIYSSYSSAKIDTNIITNNFRGIYLSGYYSWEQTFLITNNIISSNNRPGLYYYDQGGYGIYMDWGQRIVMSNNTISSHTVAGIYTGGGSDTIIGRNKIFANGTGINTYGSPVISSNTISGNGQGIYNSGTPPVTKNNLYGNTTDFYHTATSDISIPYNWWGTTETAKISAKIYDYYDPTVGGRGRVEYTPIETQEIEWWKDLTPPTGKPGTPTDAGIYSSTTTITFYWSKGTAEDPESGIGGYWLEIGEKQDSGYAVEFSSDVGNVTIYNIVNCLHGITYYARVKARSAGGDSDWSDWSDGITIDTTPPEGKPSTPTDRGDWGGETLTFKWTAGDPAQGGVYDPESGIGGYWLQVWVGTSPTTTPDESGNYKFNVDVGNVLSYDVSGCENGKMYFAWVKAKNGAGLWTVWSGISDGIMVDTEPPEIPEISEIKQEGQTVDKIKGGEVFITAKTEVGVTTTCVVTIKDQLGRILTKGISYNVTIGTGGIISGNIDFGELTKNYPVASGIIIEITVEDRAGNRATSTSQIISIATIGVKFILYNNLFDPTKNQAVVIRYELTSSENVSIKVYDFRGNLVRDLVNKNYPAGVHTETWDGKNDDSVIVASGIYLIQIKTGSFKETKKVAVVE